ncbi:hypothetical protein T261_0735 [Streptomyces lydicus]|nr:hypothetical protein T261_0735 [Streptomyces lydicus]
MNPTHDTGLAANERQLLNATLLIRQHIHERYKPGDELPSPPALAEAVGLPKTVTVTAMRRLDTLGVIAIGALGSRPVLLAPDAHHPKDIALDLSVRERIDSGYYQPGQALPVGILGREHNLAIPQVERACRRLIADRLLYRDTEGPHGPGLYITRVPDLTTSDNHTDHRSASPTQGPGQPSGLGRQPPLGLVRAGISADRPATSSALTARAEHTTR